MTTHLLPQGTIGPKAKPKAPQTDAPAKKRKPAAKAVDMPKVEVSAEQREAERRDGERREAERRAEAQSNASMAFALNTLSTPPQATNEYEQKLAELQKQYGIQAKSVPVRVQRDARNGITRPADGTKTGLVWHVADAITVAKGRPAAIAELKLHPDLIGVNDHTMKTQYARWRQYNHVTGRINPLAPAPQKVMDHDGNP